MVQSLVCIFYNLLTSIPDRYRQKPMLMVTGMFPRKRWFSTYAGLFSIFSHSAVVLVVMSMANSSAVADSRIHGSGHRSQ